MKTIIIKTQAEIDALPRQFKEYTIIEIRSTEKIYVNIARENSSVEAWGNSSVEAWGNSSVVARENSSVVARENSSVEAGGNSSVEAWGNSSVEAWGNSSVVARENSSVEAWGNSSVEAGGNSSVVARENSSVVARGNSSVELFISAYIIVLSASVLVKKLLDQSTAVFKGCKIRIEEKSDTANAREIPADIDVSFEEWLRRGYVNADGITKKLVSQKKIKDISIYECQEFPKKTTSYVVKRGDVFSHGETVEKAIEDLRYKIGNRDVSEFEHLKNDLDKTITIDDAIAAYRVITGACEFGVKEFMKSIEVPDKLTPRIVLTMTAGKFGHETFKRFLEVTP